MTFLSQVGYVGLIGDVHAEDALLEAALDYLKGKNVEVILCTGDVADGFGSVARCCELLHQNGVHTVRGNHDRWLIADVMRVLPEATDKNELPVGVLDYLTNLEVTREFSSSLGGILLCHGLGPNDMAKIEPHDAGYALEANDELQTLMRNPGYRFVFNGHTHHAMVRHINRLTVVNAGTLRRNDDPGFMLLDFKYRQVEMLRFGRKHQIALERTTALLSGAVI